MQQPMGDSIRTPVRSQQVYFIQGLGGGPIKIGTSKDVRKRLNTLQAGSPVALRLLASIEGGSQLERDFHEAFEDDRLHGEWFNNSEALVSCIGRMLARSPQYTDRMDEVQHIVEMAAEDDDMNYLAVEAETARYIRYVQAQERMKELQSEAIDRLNDVWHEYTPDIGWHPADHIWRSFLKRYPPEIVHQAAEITAPRCNQGKVKHNSYWRYMWGVMKRLVNPEPEDEE